MINLFLIFDIYISIVIYFMINLFLIFDIYICLVIEAFSQEGSDSSS